MCFKTQGLFKCGKCPECLQERRNEWAIRLIQESRLYGCFSALLTYRPEDVPLTKDGQMSLCKKDVQKFLKRLRHKLNEPFKYYISAEYSPEKFRPHYHCLFFGFPKTLTSDEIKETLSQAWGLGFIGSYSNWIKDDAQVNYALGYLMLLYEWNKDDPRERPWRLLSKGIALEYIPTPGLVVNNPINSNLYGWCDSISGEIVNDDVRVEIDSVVPKDINIDFFKGPEFVEKRKLRYVPNRYRLISPIHFDGTVDDNYNDSIDLVKIQQTKFNSSTRTTTLGKVNTFKLPRRWRENMLSYTDRLFLRELNTIKAFRKNVDYLEQYGEYDDEVDFPMWKQIKYMRWKLKKKNKKDKLLNSPESYL